MGHPLVLVHVLTSPALYLGGGYVSPTVYEEIDPSIRLAARKRLDRLVAGARAAGIRATGVLLRAFEAGKAELTQE